MPTDIAIHMALEAIGGLTCACTLRYCKHFWLRAFAWFLVALVFSVLTVMAVG